MSKTKPFIIFDLDDTLYKEIDFLRSAYKYIAYMLSKDSNNFLYMEMIAQYKIGKNVFKWLTPQFPNYKLSDLINIYREHKPDISLYPGVKALLDKLKSNKIPMGLITDGRSITQRNKITALGIENYFNDIIISEEFGSEKPCIKNYIFFEDRYKNHEFYYVGDNLTKDFITPNSLGWETYCLIDNGQNTHNQSFQNPDLKQENLPKNLFDDYNKIEFFL